LLYYEVGSDGETIYKNGVFAPIGLHIIHKTTSFPDYDEVAVLFDTARIAARSDRPR
jgi:hypothetical protein